MDGGDGNDLLIAFGSSPSTLSGGLGDDVLSASASTGGVVLDGGAGNDVFSSGSGNDSIIAGDGNDAVFFSGSFGQDTVDGGAGMDGLTVVGHTVGEFNQVDNGDGTFTIDFGGSDTIHVKDVEFINLDDGSVRIV